jgi:hypothetical protein
LLIQHVLFSSLVDIVAFFNGVVNYGADSVGKAYGPHGNAEYAVEPGLVSELVDVIVVSLFELEVRFENVEILPGLTECAPDKKAVDYKIIIPKRLEALRVGAKPPRPPSIRAVVRLFIIAFFRS